MITGVLSRGRQVRTSEDGSRNGGGAPTSQGPLAPLVAGKGKRQVLPWSLWEEHFTLLSVLCDPLQTSVLQNYKVHICAAAVRFCA